MENTRAMHAAAAAALMLTAALGLQSPIARADDAQRKLVVVALRLPEESAGEAVGQGRERRRSAIHAAQQRVLDRVTPSGLNIRARWKHVAGFAAMVTEQERRRLESDPDVLRVDEDVPGRASLAQSVPLIGGDTVRVDGWTGDGVTVAIVDSGIATGHNELDGAVTAEACFCTNANGSGCCPNGQTQQFGSGAAADDDGHGTHVAGIVAGRGISASPGVAPDADLVAVRVLDSNGSFFSTTQIVSGLDWLLDNRPEVDVVNMSLGTDSVFAGSCDSLAAWSIALADAINALVARGTTVVSASGNDGEANAMSAPGCIQNSLTVGATYDAAAGSRNWSGCSDATTAADQIVCFSNASSELDLLAPGALIVSLDDDGGTVTNSGTSMAAPHVAGAAAVLMHVDPTITPIEIAAMLAATGVPRFDARNGSTWPRINLLAAVNAVDEGGSSDDLILNGGFEDTLETGNVSPGWTVQPAIGHTLIQQGGSFPHGGTAYAYLGSTNSATDILKQTVEIPDNAETAELKFWVNVVTTESSGASAFDFLWVDLYQTNGSWITELAQVTNQHAPLSGNTNGVYFDVGPIDLSEFAGSDVQVVFQASTDSTLPTTFRIDDVSLVVAVEDEPPSTSITTPSDGATVSGTVDVDATATDDEGIASLSIWVDGVQRASNSNSTSLSYEWDTTTVANGAHTIVSKATDSGGHETTSNTIDVTVSNLPAVTIIVADSDAAEAGPNSGTLTVTRTGSTGSSLTVHYDVGGTATSGSDFAALSGSVTIPAGQNSAPVVITPIDDALLESYETVVVTLDSGAGYTIGNPNSAQATIRDNDGSITVTASDPNASETGPDTGTFTVTRTGSLNEALTINYNITGTATGSTDYSALAGAMVIASDSASAAVVVTPILDLIAEGTETVILTIAGSSHYRIGSPSSATVSIGDAFGPPTNVAANAISTTTVRLTWTINPGAASYRVYRSSNGTSYSLAGSPGAPPFDDAAASPGTSYLYKVRSFGGVESADSNVDLATTVMFTDPTLTTSTKVTATHFNELRAAVNAVRAMKGLAPIVFSPPAPAANISILRQHLLDLRGGLDAGRAALLLPAVSYTDAAITAGATKIKVAHITDLRNGAR